MLSSLQLVSIQWRVRTGRSKRPLSRKGMLHSLKDQTRTSPSEVILS